MTAGPVDATKGTLGSDGPLRVPGTPGEPAFDAHHPPSAELASDCVHCGFCLPTCPTYVLWGEEMDSPRGRIYLIQTGLDGEPMSDAMVQHFDACLGCMACVTACPSGVQYDKLIEATRAQVERRHRRPAADRLLREAVFALFPHPKRLRLMRGPLSAYQRSGLQRIVERSGLLERVSPSLATMAALAPPVRRAPRIPEHVAARGERRAVVGMLTGCVQGEFFPRVNAATARVLAMEGCDVVVPRGQSCCGALSVHNGREAEAKAFARRTIDTFDAAGVEHVVVNAAGCGSSMKEYAELLADEKGSGGYAERARRFAANVRDVSELLTELGPVAGRHPLPVTVAYHDACHLGHAQGVRAQPRELLRGIPGVELREIADPEICCGSAGIYNIVNPGPARALGDRKARAVLDTGADLLATANPGCLMQVASSLNRMAADGVPGARPIHLAHTVEVLDASLRGHTVSAMHRSLSLPATT
jgi:glycolate oxidase iron-sulfur subunit